MFKSKIPAKKLSITFKRSFFFYTRHRLGLRIFSIKIPWPHQEVPKLFDQQEHHGLVDKTTAQQPKVQQFETDRRQGLGIRKFSLKIP